MGKVKSKRKLDLNSERIKQDIQNLSDDIRDFYYKKYCEYGRNIAWIGLSSDQTAFIKTEGLEEGAGLTRVLTYKTS